MAKRKNPEQLTPEESRKIIGNKLSFGAAEAYKLLRTNLTFSLPDTDGCKIIGVTSALRGEGKSTTSINMAYTIAQTGQKVLLVEGDLRLPTMAKRLRVASKPGLSNLLAGQATEHDAIQPSRLIDNFWVITAGDTPPNPAELLESKQMYSQLKRFTSAFDVIIIDLPPVNVVSDALIVSKMVNGIVLVVRQDYCDKGSLDGAVHQLQFVDAKILGFVLSGSDYQEKSYRHYGHYKKSHYGSYHYGYGSYDGTEPASKKELKAAEKAEKKAKKAADKEAKKASR